MLIAVMVLSTFVGYSAKAALDTIYENVLKTSSAQALEEGSRPFNFRSLKLPAVGTGGEGSLADLSVYVARGSGKVYVRIDDAENPILNPDTQESVKLAVEVARQVSNRNTSNVNIFYDIESPTIVVGGRSATAALAIATISLLRNESLRPDALITATIEPDEKGTLGKVNGIEPKANAVRLAGYSTLVIARGSAENAAEIEGRTGIRIIEADTIFDAYEEMRAK